MHLLGTSPKRVHRKKERAKRYRERGLRGGEQEVDRTASLWRTRTRSHRLPGVVANLLDPLCTLWTSRVSERGAGKRRARPARSSLASTVHRINHARRPCEQAEYHPPASEGLPGKSSARQCASRGAVADPLVLPPPPAGRHPSRLPEDPEGASLHGSVTLSPFIGAPCALQRIPRAMYRARANIGATSADPPHLVPALPRPRAQSAS